ncbi:MAG: TonB-dependent receptor [Bacteroidia bacterium]
MRKALLLLGFAMTFLVIFNPAMAQDYTISGVVLDSETDEPLIGASVQIKGTATGASTDPFGKFSFSSIEETVNLVVTYVGYNTQEMTATAGTEVSVALVQAVSLLDEAVVIGYGTQKRSSITGSVASISDEEITQTPVLRVENALQGRVSGVQITNQSGQPGDAPTITVRGVGTNGNPNPIYIVDGIQVDAIDFLNPDDIKSIDILKDAASTAIYGARGANGVVLITTSSGVKGAASAEYKTYYGIQNPWRIMDVMNATDYANFINQGALNAGRTPLYDNPDSFGTGTDWQREVYNFNAPILSHSVAFSNSSEKTSYNMALSYFGQEGIVGGDKSKFDRYTARLNLRHEINDKLNVGGNFSYALINKSAVASNQEFGGLISNAINLDPITPLYMTDEAELSDSLSQYVLNPAVRNADGQYYGISDIVAQEIVNPLARLEVTHGGSEESKFVGNAFVEYEMIPGLKFKSLVGLELSNVESNGYNGYYYLNSAQGNVVPVVSQFFGKTSIFNSENTITYTKSVGNHNFNALVGGTIRETTYEWMNGSKTGLITDDPDKVNLALATDNLSAQLFGGIVQNALVSNFGRIIYDYNDKYIFSAIVRRDGSTKFGPDNRFGVFPSFSGGWVISKENFFPQGGAISFLKLRASWGQNGSDRISDYAWVASIFSGRNYTMRDADGSETLIVGSSPAQVADPNLAWEASEQLNFGLDLTFWNDRFTVNADWFRKETKGLLIQKPVPGVAGNIAGESNVGGVLNTGVELAVNYRNDFGKLYMQLGGNATYIKNEVLTVDGAQGVLTGASISTYGTVTRMEAGLPIGYFFGYKTDGIFQNEAEVFQHINSAGDPLQPKAVPGDVRYVDNNNDGVIDDDDRTIIGSPHPDVVYGLNGSFDYGNWKATFLFFGTFGNEVFNGIRRHDLTETNFPEYFNESWSGEGSTNDMPRFTFVDANQNYSRISDIYIENGSFLRLRNLTIGYTIKPTKHISSAYIYVAGENLITLTGYRGLEPEIGARNGWVLDMGIDRGVYPQARTFRIGVDVKF